jgi:hypothetical protein
MTERGWQGRVNPSNAGPGGYVLERTMRGVKERVRFSTTDLLQLRLTPARMDRYRSEWLAGSLRGATESCARAKDVGRRR